LNHTYYALRVFEERSVTGLFIHKNLRTLVNFLTA